MSAPPPPPPPPPSSLFGSILSAPGAIASAGVGWLAGLAGYTRQQTAEIAANRGVAEAATNAAAASSVTTPAGQLEAVVGSQQVQTAMATVVAETNSSSSSAPLTGIAAIKAQLAEAAKGTSSSASETRRQECLAQFGTKHAITVGGGGSSGANATSSISRYKPKRIGNVWTAVSAQMSRQTPEGEYKTLREELREAVKVFTGSDKDKENIERIEKLIEAKAKEIAALEKSRTRRSRQQRVRRQTRRSRR